jgi:hypothetical protein
MNIIKFKWEAGTETKHFSSEAALVKELRAGNVDEDNRCSDEFIINESHALGEWEYIKPMKDSEIH